MIYISVEYNDLEELLTKLQNRNFQICSSLSHLVYVNPSEYQGCYGGLFFTPSIQTWVNVVSDEILPDVSLTWFENPNNALTGHIPPLFNDRVLITGKILKELKRKCFATRFTSKYYV